MKYTFLPQMLPAYAATETFRDLNKKHVEVCLQGGAAEPDQPRAIARSSGRPTWSACSAPTRNQRGNWSASATRPPAASLYVARPLRITDAGLPALPQHGRRRTPDHDRTLRPGQRLRLELQRNGGRADHLGARAGAARGAPNRPSRCFMGSVAAVFIANRRDG